MRTDYKNNEILTKNKIAAMYLSEETIWNYTYHENGRIENETPYVCGIKHGTSTLFRKDGTKRKWVIYENGEITNSFKD